MTCEKHARHPAKGYSGCCGCEVERLQEVERLALAFAKARGRYHSQHAMCDLLEHFGMPCVRPGEDACETVSVPRALLEELANDLEAELKHEHIDHPVTNRRLDVDMGVVRRARDILGGKA